MLPTYSLLFFTALLLIWTVLPLEAGVTQCVVCDNYVQVYSDVPDSNENQADCISSDPTKLTRFVTPCSGLAPTFDDTANMRCQVAFWTDSNNIKKVFRGCINNVDPNYGSGHKDDQCAINPLINTPTCICNSDGCNDYTGTRSVGGTVVGTGGSAALTQIKVDPPTDTSGTSSGNGTLALSPKSGNGTLSGSLSGGTSGSASGTVGGTAGATSGRDGSNTGTDLAANAEVDVAAKSGTTGNNGTGAAASTAGASRPSSQCLTTKLTVSFSFLLLLLTLLWT